MLLAAAILVTSVPTILAQESGIAVVPRPVKVTPRTGRFILTRDTTIWTDRASTAIGHQLARYLEPATGFTLAVRASAELPTRGLVLRRDRQLARLGREGYTLDVGPARVVARAPDDAGLFYALQTIRQLLPLVSGFGR